MARMKYNTSAELRFKGLFGPYYTGEYTPSDKTCFIMLNAIDLAFEHFNFNTLYRFMGFDETSLERWNQEHIKYKARIEEYIYEVNHFKGWFANNKYARWYRKMLQQFYENKEEWSKLIYQEALKYVEMLKKNIKL